MGRTSPSVDQKSPSAFAHSPASTPIKIPARNKRHALYAPALPGMDTTASPPSDDDSPPPSKRAKIDELREDDSPTPAARSSANLTMIGSTQLSQLRTDKGNLLAANNELAKENAKLKKKLASHDQVLAENDVLKVENKHLEGTLERENAENEELLVQLAQLREEKAELQGNCGWWAAQEGKWREQMQAASDQYVQLEQDYRGLVSAYNEATGQAAYEDPAAPADAADAADAAAAADAAPGPLPELEVTSPGIDLAKGFERFG